MKECIQSAAALACEGITKRPKHVIIPWHGQPLKEGQLEKVSKEKGAPKKFKESVDERALDIKFLGRVLPMLEGGYRFDLPADVSMILHTSVDSRKPNNEEYKQGIKDNIIEYNVMTKPEGGVHVGIRVAPTLDKTTLPNNFKALFEEIERGQD